MKSLNYRIPIVKLGAVAETGAGLGRGFRTGVYRAKTSKLRDIKPERRVLWLKDIRLRARQLMVGFPQ